MATTYRTAGTLSDSEWHTAMTIGVEPAGDEVRTRYPWLPASIGFVAAIRRPGGRFFDVLALASCDEAGIPTLAERARQAASDLDLIYVDRVCPWCQRLCDGAVRAGHEAAHRGSETTWRQVAA